MQCKNHSFKTSELAIYLHLEFSMSPATASTFPVINGFSHQFSSLRFHHNPQTGPANKEGLFKKYKYHWVSHYTKLIIITLHNKKHHLDKKIVWERYLYNQFWIGICQKSWKLEISLPFLEAHNQNITLYLRENW